MPDIRERAESFLKIAQSFLARRNWWSGSNTFGGRRNMERALGYPGDGELTYEKFYQEYRRDGLARRVVRLAVQATYSGECEIVENDDPETMTPFETAVADFATQTHMWSKLRRLDEVTRIGRYGVMLIGTPKQDLKTPLTKAKPGEVQYLSVYAEPNADIVKWDTTEKSERYGLPETYQLTLVDQRGITGKALGGTSFRSLSRECHHSRIIHAAENVLEDDVYGEPALMALFNAVLDAQKITGGSAEAIWKTADRGIAWNMDKDADVDQGLLDDMTRWLDEYEHDQRRNVMTKGVTPHVLGTAVADPSGVWNMVQSIIAAGTSYPQRILFGSERGQLASLEDRLNWAGIVGDRRMNYNEPWQVRALLDRLIAIGALPEPASPYMVKWPPVLVLSDQEKAQIANMIANAVKTLADQGAQTGRMVLSFEEFRENFLDGWVDGPLPKELAAMNDAIDKKKIEIAKQPLPPPGQPGANGGKPPPQQQPPGQNGNSRPSVQ